MKRIVYALLVSVLLTCAAFAQIVGSSYSNPSTLTFPAVEYSTWQGVLLTGNAGTGSQTYLIATTGAHPGNRGAGVAPYSAVVLTPVLFNNETVTPTAIACGQTAPTGTPVPAGSILCNFTGSFSNAHGANERVFSGDGGLLEAQLDAINNSGGVVTFDAKTAGTEAQAITYINAAVPYPNVGFEDFSTSVPQYLSPIPSTTSLLAAGTTLTPQAACDATHQFCSDANVAGSASWGSTVHGCYTLVDVNGNESPCSSDQSFTSVASKAIDMGVSFTARTDNVVGWKPYLSVSGGSYALTYSVPLLTQPTVLLAVPVSAGVCTLTTIETITPACAIANTTYNQAGSTTGVNTLFKGGMQFTGYPVVTNTLAPEIGSVSATAYNPNEEAHATYAYIPGSHVALAGVQSEHIIFPITAAAQTTVGEVAGTFPLPANFMNYVGRTIEICGVFVKTSTTADTLTKFQLWWDAEGSNVTAGTPVQLTNMQSTYATALAAAANFQFCQQITTTVASTSATGGTITPGQGWFTVNQVAAGANPSAGSTNLVAAVGSLNLALPAHITLVVNHTTGTDGAGATLISASLRIIN
jgi:hypothetical protein